MADSKITALTSIGTSTDPAVDPLVLVDVSDTSMAATGTTKKVTLNNLLSSSPTATGNFTITGDLTVDTSTLKVDSANNRVGIGTASPSAPLDVQSNTSGTGIMIRGRSDNSNALRFYANDGTTQQCYIGADNSNIDFLSEGGRPLRFFSNALLQYQINPLGVFTWYDGAGGTRMTLNSTGLGVGTSPSATLDIRKNASGSRFLSYHTGGNGTVTAGADLNEMRCDDTTTAYNLLNINVLGTSRFLLTSTGNVGIGVTPSAGKGCLQLSSGINFPATQVASTDANTLDDYEEGTWTGTLTGGTTNPTTPVTATGRYTKIGRVVTVQISFTNVDTTGASGLIQITGLPFANNGSVGTNGSVSLYLIATFTGSPFASIGVNESFISLYANNSGGAFTDVTHNAGASKYLTASVTYTVA